MSDQEEPTTTKKSRLSAVKTEDSMNTEGSGDEIDDSISIGTGSLADDSSRSETPTQFSSKHTKRGKGGKFSKRRLQYKCTNCLKEDHGQPIFGVQFNYNIKEGDPLIFASVGSNRVTIYEIQDEGKMKLLQAYVDADADENFYSCAWSYDEVTGQPLLAAAGQRGMVRIISPVNTQCIKHFIGHGQSINELKFHPKDPNLLLSISKDHTLRLWNLKTDVCVAKFGGVDGHRDEVLSGDINLEGTHIVSCGMDHSLKIWKLTKPRVLQTIKESYNFDTNDPKAKAFPTVSINYPDFTTRDIHRNYVDCAKWLGKFILSKSCENRIVCWKPGKMNDFNYNIKLTDSKTSILHQFDFKECDIWFMRFSMDYGQKVIALGNQVGRVFVWDMDVDDPAQARCSVLQTPKCGVPIRQTNLSRDGNILICVSDDGCVYRWDRIR